MTATQVLEISANSSLSPANSIKGIKLNKSAQKKPKDAMTIRIDALCKKLGISTNAIGYNYLVYGVKIAHKDPTYLEATEKKLYVDIAIKFETVSFLVSSLLKCIIDKMQDNANQKFYNEVFERKAKLSPKDLIIGIAEYLKKEDKKSK